MNRRDLANEQRYLTTLFVLALLVLGCASASSPAADEAVPREAGLAAYPAAQLDEPPRLIGCSDAQGPTPNTIKGVRWDIVTLLFIVTEAGRVDPASIVATRTESTQLGGPASDASISEARQRALTCRYEPGRLDSQIVRASLERTFRILAEP
jgi:hypothetical protein